MERNDPWGGIDSLNPPLIYATSVKFLDVLILQESKNITLSGFPRESVISNGFLRRLPWRKDLIRYFLPKLWIFLMRRGFMGKAGTITKVCRKHSMKILAILERGKRKVETIGR